MAKPRREGPYYQAFGERLGAAIGAAGFTQTYVAQKMGVHRSTVTHWKAGSMPDPPVMMRLAALFGMTREQLLGERRYSIDPTALAVAEAAMTSQTEPELVRLTRHAAQIGAGPGYVDELPEPREYGFTLAWLRRLGYTDPKNDDPRLSVFKVAHTYGDSMEPTIRPDAILLADMGSKGEGHRKIEKGRIYVIDLGRAAKSSEKGLTVKRLAYSKPAREIVLWGDNRAHAPETVTLEEGQPVSDLVRGLVRWVGQEVS